jgi:2-polyprenyl-6-methoxyphenol hydroxylase-like FAD-dependent oxidoreductase
MNQTPVLIVGAGPTGLALALFLSRAGVAPRIIDKNSGPGQASRAMVVQARTLEFYRQIGLADVVVDGGIPIDTLQVRRQGRAVAEINIHDFGKGSSPYPFVLSYPQDDHERLLVERLKATGIEVEWDTELTEIRESSDAVHATLRKNNGAREECAATYLCGCDGARSVVRPDRGLGFAGGTYDKTFFVADVQATGEAAAHHSMSICLNAQDFMLVFPIRSTGMNRLIGVIPEALAGREEVTFEEIRPYAEAVAEIRVDTVNWFSTYRVHHRVADHFRVGRVFLCGDAAHIHSPVGGQGMNTGIGDSVNLAWKLAASVQGRADASILDTYEPERIGFARSLVATTDRMFQLMVGSGVGNHLFRDALFPHLAPFALGFSSVRNAAFRLVSQTRISYHDSALSDGAAGDIHGGDRLPWTPLADGRDNFAPLQSLDWQIHVYGGAGQALRDAASEAKLALHEFGWADPMGEAGLQRDALYLVRPDGYVALADITQDVARLRGFLSRFKIVPLAVSSAPSPA